jgi:hypothetical protein
MIAWRRVVGVVAIGGWLSVGSIFGMAVAPSVLAAGCSQWNVAGSWDTAQANGYDVAFDFAQTDQAVTGSALSVVTKIAGSVAGTLAGDQLDVVVTWSGNAGQGRYDATVISGGITNGTTAPLAGTGTPIGWTGSGPTTCVAAAAAGGVTSQVPTSGSTPGGGGVPILPIAGLVALAAVGLGVVGYTMRGRGAAAAITAGAATPSVADPGLAGLQSAAPAVVQANLDAGPPASPPPGTGTQLASVGAARFGMPAASNATSYGEIAGTSHPASEQAYESIVVGQAPAATREAPLVAAPVLEEETRVQPGVDEENTLPDRPRGPEEVVPEAARRVR